MKVYNVTFIAQITKNVIAEDKEDARDLTAEYFENELTANDDLEEFKIINVDMVEDLDEEEKDIEYLNREYERSKI